MEWSPLQPGDQIEVVAPASKCSWDELKAGQVWLEKQGYKVLIPEDIFTNDPFHANTDEVRFEKLKKAFLRKETKAIWCARGGYGSQRLLSRFLKSSHFKIHKPFIGLSDITSLHLFFNEKLKLPTLHSPILSRIGRGDLPQTSVLELIDILCGNKNTVEFKELVPMNRWAEKKNTINGKMIGGNLATLVSHFGTPWAPQFKEGILFLEDVSERGYKVDRLLYQLSHQAQYKNVKAILFGDFTDGLDPNGENLIPYALHRFAETQKIPVLQGIPAGHGMIQRTLPLGSVAELNLKTHSLQVASGIKGRK